MSWKRTKAGAQPHSRKTGLSLVQEQVRGGFLEEETSKTRMDMGCRVTSCPGLPGGHPGFNTLNSSPSLLGPGTVGCTVASMS